MVIKRALQLMIVAGLVISSMSLILPTRTSVPATILYVPHAVISVEGNVDLGNQAAIEGWPGSGLGSDPYVIADLEIDAGWAEWAVSIANTSASIVLRDCMLMNASSGALRLFNVTYCNVENTTCTGSYDGIVVENSRLDSFVDCSCMQNSQDGLSGTSSTQITISGGVYTQNQMGVRLYAGTSHVSIMDANCYGNSGEGISLVGVSNTTISGSNCSNCNFGINSIQTSDNMYVGNNISGCSVGIRLVQSVRETLSGNNCSACTTGIHVTLSDSIRIDNNSCYDDSTGIHLEDSSGCMLANDTCTECSGFGIKTLSSDGISIDGCVLSYNWDGISLELGSNITVRNCSSSDNSYGGIMLLSVYQPVLVMDCSFDRNGNIGMHISMMGFFDLVGNHLSDNCYEGIIFDVAQDGHLRDNVLVGNGINLYRNVLSDLSSHDIDQSNTANGRAVVYLVDEVGPIDVGDAGQVLMVNCTDIILDGLNLSNASVGLFAYTCTNITVVNTDLSENYHGTYIEGASRFHFDNNSVNGSYFGIFGRFDNSTFSNNTVGGLTYGTGIEVTGSDNVIIGNRLQNLSTGIDVMGERNKVCWNTVADCWYGIGADILDGQVCNNTVVRSSGYDLRLGWSFGTIVDNNTLGRAGSGGIYATQGGIFRNNAMTDSGFFLAQGSLSAVTSFDIDQTNSVNGRPVMYYIDLDGFDVPMGAGQVLIFNCSDITIHDQNLSSATIGIQVMYCDNVTISRVDCSANDYIGIFADEDDNLSIADSTFSNDEFGVRISSSTTGTISNCSISYCYLGLYITDSSWFQVHDNLFYGCSYLGAYFDMRTTYNIIWNNTFAYNNGATDSYSPIHVQAAETWMSTNNTWYLPGSPHGWGNYWGDWTGPDANLDGIVDLPYNVSWSNSDKFPRTTPTVPYQPIPEFSLLFVVVVTLASMLFLTRKRGNMA